MGETALLLNILPEDVNTYHTPGWKGEQKMSGKKEKKIRLDQLTKEEKLKYEIAEELGLLDRVMEEGWKSLSSKETGRIGGLMTKKRREASKDNRNITNIN